VLDALDEGPNILELVPFRRERAVFGDGGSVIVFRMGDVSSGNGIEIRLEAEGKRGWEKEQDALHEVYTPGKANYQNHS
jgi:hypothetical protein